MSLEVITLEVLPTCTGLDENSARNYFRAKITNRPILKRRIIDPFEELLKRTSPFDDKNLPSEEGVNSITLGNITFTIESSKVVKRPELKAVFGNFKDYLRFIRDGNLEGLRRRGVRTFEGRPYLLLSDALGTLADLHQVKKYGLSTKITHDGHPDQIGPVVLPLSSEVTLTKSQALLYLAAKTMEAHLAKNVVSLFEALLKSATDYSSEDVPDKTIVTPIPVGSYLFDVTTIPEATVSYRGILDDLAKPAPQKINKRSKIGELELIKLSLPLETDLYNPRSESGATGNQYISVTGALERLAELKKIHTKPSINKIVHGPYSLA